MDSFTQNGKRRLFAVRDWIKANPDFYREESYGNLHSAERELVERGVIPPAHGTTGSIAGVTVFLFMGLLPEGYFRYLRSETMFTRNIKEIRPIVGAAQFILCINQMQARMLCVDWADDWNDKYKEAALVPSLRAQVACDYIDWYATRLNRWWSTDK